MFTIILSIFLGCMHLHKEYNEESVDYIQAIKLEDPVGNVVRNDNFVSFTKHMLLSEEREFCKPDVDCSILGPVVSSASGSVIRNIDDQYYALTAAHFCINDEEIDRWLGPTGKVITVAMTGIETKGTIEKIDIPADMCLISYTINMRPKIKIKRLKLADNMPKIGDDVYTISAPLGVTAPAMRLHFDGKFGGCDEIEDMCIFTLPSTFGSSGSLVFDDRGHVIGMIQLSLHDFEHAAAGFGVKSIRNFLEEYREETGIKLY